jgi:hypothetical protein
VSFSALRALRYVQFSRLKSGNRAANEQKKTIPLEFRGGSLDRRRSTSIDA